MQIDVLQKAMHQLSTGESGHLRFGGIEPFVSLHFPSVIQSFLKLHPNIRASLETRGTTAIHGMVQRDEIDLGLTTPPSPHSGLLFEPLLTETIVALVPQSHLVAESEGLSVVDLHTSRVILTNPTCAYRDLIQRALIQQGVQLEPTLEIGSLPALKALVQKNLGIALLPKTATYNCPDDIVVKELDFELCISIGLVHKFDTMPLLRTKTMDTFVMLLKQSLLVGYDGSLI